MEILRAESLKVRVGEREILKGTSISLISGQKLFLTGDNGAGKTTLIETLMGFITPTEGSIYFKGKICRNGRDWKEVRRAVGYVFQNPDEQLFCPTVEEEIAFAPLAAGKSREETESIVNSILKSLDIEHLRHKNTHRLSGGEKRIVSIAAVLSMKPDFLILDEPTVGLDKHHFKLLVELLKRLKTGVLIVTHDQRLIDTLGWRQLLLEDGKIRSLNEICQTSQGF